jgi:hypothetical protein
MGEKPPLSSTKKPPTEGAAAPSNPAHDRFRALARGVMKVPVEKVRAEEERLKRKRGKPKTD